MLQPFMGFNCEGTELAVLPAKCFDKTSITALHIPSQIKEIGDACFASCKRRKVLTIQEDTCRVIVKRNCPGRVKQSSSQSHSPKEL
jgi:hypothetical protein